VKTQAPARPKPSRGRRPGDPHTREAIIDAARRQFSERGYRATTLRSVASEAGVDHRLLLHYFGSKRRLFAASIELPVDPEGLLERAFAAGEHDRARVVAQIILGVLEEPQNRQRLLALLRSAVSEPEAAELVREAITERALKPIAQQLGGDHPELRASMLGSQFVGIAMARYVVGIEPLASAAHEEVVAAVTPVFEHYLHGDLSGEPARDEASAEPVRGRPKAWRSRPTPYRPSGSPS